MTKFGMYHYRLVLHDHAAWGFEILHSNGAILRKSTETFPYRGIARLAAIGQITLLERGA
jgi:hypothetical protein